MNKMARPGSMDKMARPGSTDTLSIDEGFVDLQTPGAEGDASAHLGNLMT